MTKEKLTDKQLKIVQVVAGVLCALALIVSIYVASLKAAEENVVLQYLFLVVFLVVMFGRRKIESKYRLRLSLFSLVLIDGISVGVLIYIIVAFYFSPATTQVVLDDTIKILIVVGLFLLLFILGIALPLKRYFKRKEEGTIIPIRLPEKPPVPESEEPEEEIEETSGQSAIERQIAEMTKDLDKKDGEDK